MKWSLAIISTTILLLSTGPSMAISANDAIGTWKTKTGRHVQLYMCGAKLCGKISKAKAGEKDINNPNPAKQKRSLIGVHILSGASPSSANAWKGTLYNTRDGKNYTGYITVKSAGSLSLSGCVLGGLICNSEDWKRIN